MLQETKDMLVAKRNTLNYDLALLTVLKHSTDEERKKELRESITELLDIIHTLECELQIMTSRDTL